MKRRYLWLLLPPAVFLMGWLFGWFVTLDPDVRQWEPGWRILLGGMTLFCCLPAGAGFFD